MASKNLLSMEKDDMMKDGALALSSGQVSPEEAIAAAKKFGLDEKMADPKWLSNYVSPELNPYTMKPSMKLSDLEKPGPVGKDEMMKSELKSKQETGTKQIRNSNYSADEFAGLYDTIQNLPDIKAQREGLDKYNQLLDMQAGKADDNGVLKGLAALTDTWTGSKFSGMIPAESKKDSIMKLRDDAQKRQQDLTKTVLDGITKLKSGSDQQTNTNQLIQAMMASQGDVGSGRENRLAAKDDWQKEEAMAKDVRKLSDDYVGISTNFKSVKEAIAHGDTRSVNQILSNMARNIGEEKGPLTDTDANRMVLKDLNTKISEIEAWLGAGNPQISPELKASLNKLVERASRNLDARYKEVLGGRKKRYEAGGASHMMAPGNVGDEIFKDAESKVPKTEEKVKVKNADGQIGMIPKSQLEAALKSKKYTKVD